MTRKPALRAVPREAPDYTSRAYWTGTIKMSLSKFFILCVLHERPMHGYEITRAVERVTNGCCSPTEGTIYPVLREFEEGGYVTSEASVVSGRQRKTYTLTDKGREAFAVGVDAWMDVTRALVDTERLVLAPKPSDCCR
ncbi:MAG TPA: PadR family transcriptional regulator [Geminicoccus sp.]|jgi:DNA-binding PadR family transcriptional regulator|uniref:PadR family transcriptional regulator n=1 Tax=Geminicoccus sp. TaxID=2024832 RepID=UPI002E32B1CE|nr:PadR family transcriptional regulator [Geminicoccus sp.]HEX2528647.1 PadR family transcriptional regulator [Geminicoccus sp.]